jgi:hypothetical protein
MGDFGERKDFCSNRKVKEDQMSANATTIASDLVSVAPLSLPTGRLFFYDRIYKEKISTITNKLKPIK